MPPATRARPIPRNHAQFPPVKASVGLGGFLLPEPPVIVVVTLAVGFFFDTATFVTGLRGMVVGGTVVAGGSVVVDVATAVTGFGMVVVVVVGAMVVVVGAMVVVVVVVVGAIVVVVGAIVVVVVTGVKGSEIWLEPPPEHRQFTVP